MTRLGWAILALIVTVAGGFASMLSIGGPSPARRRIAVLTGIPAVRERGSGASGLLAVPVAGVSRGSIVDTWGQARSEGREHHGTDIPATAGTPVLAATTGTVEKLFQSRLGGFTLYLRSLDRRWVCYYAHLAGYAPGLREGQRVRRGDPLGFVGDTGDAGPGNYHLHFGLTRMTPAQRWWEGEDVDAYPMLAGIGAHR